MVHIKNLTNPIDSKYNDGFYTISEIMKIYAVLVFIFFVACGLSYFFRWGEPGVLLIFLVVLPLMVYPFIRKVPIHFTRDK